MTSLWTAYKDLSLEAPNCNDSGLFVFFLKGSVPVCIHKGRAVMHIVTLKWNLIRLSLPLGHLTLTWSFWRRSSVTLGMRYPISHLHPRPDQRCCGDANLMLEKYKNLEGSKQVQIKFLQDTVAFSWWSVCLGPSSIFVFERNYSTHFLKLKIQHLGAGKGFSLQQQIWWPVLYQLKNER